MAYAFVNQTSATATTGVSSIALPSYTPVAGNTLLFFLFITGGNGGSSANLTDGGVGNSYQQLFTPVHTASGIYGFYAQNVAGVATTVTANFVGGTSHAGIYLAEYSGIYQLLGSNAVEVSAPGTGANALSSSYFSSGGTPVMVWGFAVDASGTAPNAGTSPISFTGQAPVWAPLGAGGTSTCALGEDAAYSAGGSYIAAPFGPINQFDSYYAAGASF